MSDLDELAKQVSRSYAKKRGLPDPSSGGCAFRLFAWAAFALFAAVLVAVGRSSPAGRDLAIQVFELVGTAAVIVFLIAAGVRIGTRK